MRAKLLAVRTGIGKSSGRPYAQVTLRTKRENGETVVAQHWVKPELVVGLEEDTDVFVTAEMDSMQRFQISRIAPVAAVTKGGV